MNKKKDFNSDSYIKIHVNKEHFDSRMEVSKLDSPDVSYYLCMSLTMVIEAVGNDSNKTLGEKLDMLNHLTEIMQKMLKYYNEFKLAGKNVVETD